MAIVNPGNALPIYDNIRDQVRYRTGDQNFAFVADYEVLIPWQLPLEFEVDTVQVFLIGREIGQTNYNLSDNVTLHCNGAADRHVITWAGNRIDPVLECGFYFLQIRSGSGSSETVYWSEMLYVETRNDYEAPSLGTATIGVPPDTIVISTDDGAQSTDIVSSLKEIWNGTSWDVSAEFSFSSLASGSPLADGTEEKFLRRTLVLESGAILKTTYRANWDPLDPSGTLSYLETATENTHARPDRFYLLATNDPTDIDNGNVFVLYQQSYTQRVDLTGFLSYPQGETILGKTTDGNGNETVNSMIAKERRSIQFAKIPDDSLFFFQTLQYLDDVKLYDTISGMLYTLVEVDLKVSPEPNGYFNTVELSWRHLATNVSTCDQNEVFNLCGD